MKIKLKFAFKCLTIKSAYKLVDFLLSGHFLNQSSTYMQWISHFKANCNCSSINRKKTTCVICYCIAPANYWDLSCQPEYFSPENWPWFSLRNSTWKKKLFSNSNFANKNGFKRLAFTLSALYVTYSKTFLHPDSLSNVTDRILPLQKCFIR